MLEGKIKIAVPERQQDESLKQVYVSSIHQRSTSVRYLFRPQYLVFPPRLLSRPQFVVRPCTAQCRLPDPSPDRSDPCGAFFGVTQYELPRIPVMPCPFFLARFVGLLGPGDCCDSKQQQLIESTALQRLRSQLHLEGPYRRARAPRAAACSWQ